MQMCEAGFHGEAGFGVDGMEQMGRALHELCQPLTTLQCGLELAGLTDTAEGYRMAVDVGLNECARLAERVHQMREIVRSTMAEAEAVGWKAMQ
jgi:signal transduction histidine kinase